MMLSRDNSGPCGPLCFIRHPKCEARVVAPRLLAADNLDEFFEVSRSCPAKDEESPPWAP